MKQAILLISVSSGKENGGVEQIKRSIYEKFPKIPIYQGFTGKQSKNKEDSIENVLLKMKQDGIEQGYLLPLYLLDGFEYTKILSKIEESKIVFVKEKPFLCKEENRKYLASIFVKQCNYQEKTCWVYVGHGTKHQAQSLYQKLKVELELKGRKDIIIATLEGENNFEDVIKYLKLQEVNTVHLLPLMLCGGTHLERDIIGEQGWKQKLSKEGYSVICHFGEISTLPEVKQIYLETIRNMLKGQ